MLSYWDRENYSEGRLHHQLPTYLGEIGPSIAGARISQIYTEIMVNRRQEVENIKSKISCSTYAVLRPQVGRIFVVIYEEGRIFEKIRI